MLNGLTNPPTANTDMEKPFFKASDGGQIDILGERKDVTQSELQWGSGTEMLLSIKIRPEAFPTGSPVSVLFGLLQYLGKPVIMRSETTRQSHAITSLRS